MYVNVFGYVGVFKVYEDFFISDILRSLFRFLCDFKFDNYFLYIEYIK